MIKWPSSVMMPAPSSTTSLAGFKPAFSTAPVETAVIAMPRIDARTASVIQLLRENEIRRGRRQKEYSNTFGKLSRSVTTRLARAVLQFAEYWHSKEFEGDTKSNFADLHKNLVLDLFRSAASTFSPSPLYNLPRYRLSLV